MGSPLVALCTCDAEIGKVPILNMVTALNPSTVLSVFLVKIFSIFGSLSVILVPMNAQPHPYAQASPAPIRILPYFLQKQPSEYGVRKWALLYGERFPSTYQPFDRSSVAPCKLPSLPIHLQLQQQLLHVRCGSLDRPSTLQCSAVGLKIISY